MRTRALLVCLGLLLAVPSAAAQDRPEGRRTVPADRLPVLGTVGDLPPAEMRVLVEIEKPGWMTVDGKYADIASFRKTLRARAAKERDDRGFSKLHLVIRADKDLPWQAARWIFAECAAPEAKVRRVLFAVRPEDGGEEGAFAAYLGDGEIPAAERPLDIHLRLWDLRDTMSPWDAYAYLGANSSHAKNLHNLAVVSGVPRMSTGLVLETADALIRWGVSDVRLEGPAAETVADLERALKGLPPAEGRLSIMVRKSQIRAFGETSRRAPRIPRIGGQLAGIFAERSYSSPTAPSKEPVPVPVSIAGSPGELPRLGIVGDLPPESETLVVEVDASGTLAVNGARSSMAALDGILGQAARKQRDPALSEVSRLHVVLRLDRRLPWIVAHRLITLCLAQDPRVSRILFSAMPEDGGPEGAVATFAPILVREGARRRTLRDGRVLDIRVRVLLKARAGLLPRHLVRGLRDSRGPWPAEDPWFVNLRPMPDVPVGTVLEVLDMTLRWGATVVHFSSDDDVVDDRTELRELVPMFRSQGGHLSVLVDGSSVLPHSWDREADPPLPRVKGWMVGLANPEPIRLIPAPAPTPEPKDDE